jgi:hypothetical protein
MQVFSLVCRCSSCNTVIFSHFNLSAPRIIKKYTDIVALSKTTRYQCPKKKEHLGITYAIYNSKSEQVTIEQVIGMINPISNNEDTITT